MCAGRPLHRFECNGCLVVASSWILMCIEMLIGTGWSCIRCASGFRNSIHFHGWLKCTFYRYILASHQMSTNINVLKSLSICSSCRILVIVIDYIGILFFYYACVNSQVFRFTISHQVQYLIETKHAQIGSDFSSFFSVAVYRASVCESI